MRRVPILLKNVRVHNLKGVDLELTSHELIVFTGVSGSGKSSLAFDTIYVEGQRRYIESLSASARHTLGQMRKPEVDEVVGLSPTISIEQKTAGRNPRSTVGTLTEIYDYLRVLFARCGKSFCPVSGERLFPESQERIIQRLKSLAKGQRLLFLAPLVRGKKGEFKEELLGYLQRGYSRARIDGHLIDLEEEFQLDRKKQHTIDLVIDRLVLEEEQFPRLEEAVTMALEMGKGTFILLNPTSSEETLFSTHAYSPASRLSYPPLQPTDFSFNSPQGMCSECLGLGEGCSSCKGGRLKPYPAAARLGGKRIAEITALTIEEALAFFRAMELDPFDQEIAEELLKEIERRLCFLVDVGLSYLSLNRTAPSLSGGEAQRVRLASQVGCGLVGVVYVLDEPSIGLHPQDNKKLIATLKQLRDAGNTVIVVEHDEETILAADRVVDFGPGAGVCGGEILVNGSFKELIQEPRSLTGAYLSGRKEIALPSKRRKPGKERLTLKGASHHNLKKVTLDLPLGLFIAVTGVSGSGKSSLIGETLYPLLMNRLHQSTHPVGAFEQLLGLEHIDKVIAIDQSPIGRTPRSNPATYIKIFDEIRLLYSKLPESQARGYGPGRFSFNEKLGACPECRGRGMKRLDMDFMEEVYLPCESCHNKRFDQETLSILYKGKSISDVLEMTVKEALDFFHAIPSLRRKLEVTGQVGMEYISLGQLSTTLSGGEAQRIKLAKELVRPPSGKTLYILDEPSTGLHLHDVEALLKALHALVELGNSVLVIEHHMEIVKTADWVIDLGPQGGVQGGTIIGEGTPEQIASLKTPTGRALSEVLKKRTLSFKKAPVEEARVSGTIVVRGACQNNLRGVDVEIPHGKMTVCSGPSGSGKSSFAFETIYAEGQRRYTESLSAYARQFVQQMPKPKVGRIEGLCPAIAIEQKLSSGNPRSTVGTLTEIYDYLRILFTHLGTPFCPETGEPIEQLTKERVVDKILEMPEGTPIYVLAPLILGKHESFEDLRSRLLGQGYLRLFLNQTLYALDEEIPFDPKRKNTLALVIDRFRLGKTIRSRLYEAVERADRLTRGKILIRKEEEEVLFNLAFGVVKTGRSYPEITPHTFSFNHLEGMCLDCMGLGVQYGANLEQEETLLNLSVRGLFALLWNPSSLEPLLPLLKQERIDPTKPLRTLSPSQLHFLFKGQPAKEGVALRFLGIEPALERAAKLARSPIRSSLIPLLEERVCSACLGSRLNPLGRHVRLGAHSIATLCHLPTEEALSFLEELSIPESKQLLLKEVFEALRVRLRFLVQIGLSYLSLDRKAPTLSNGEAQRIRLARQLGSSLTGTLYVLDEPTIGLHPHDVALINGALKQLLDLGNTLLLVEHDPLTLCQADRILDFGPGAGIHGGRLLAQGTVAEILENPHSLTGAYLSGRKKIPQPKKRRPFKESWTLSHARTNNLKDLSFKLPLGLLTCLTGVSGSGKSTLLQEEIRPRAALLVRKEEIFNKLIVIDQEPIGQTVRSDVGTYTHVLPLLREFYAELPAARTKGLQPKHFSTNHRRGMCTHCWGLGYRRVELLFLPAVRIECEGCRGMRLNPVSLQVEYKGLSFGKLLQTTLVEAHALFSALPKPTRILETLLSVGLGYLKLGQETASLSGGEAQRVKLAAELAKRSTGKTLYLLDEPTTGLHPEDIAQLLEVLHALVDKGNTLVVIEHNLDVIRNADYVLELGPVAGEKGGYLVAKGSPEELMTNPNSLTARYLL